MSFPKKRQRGLDINVYIPDDSSPVTRTPPPPVVIQRHTTYHSTNDALTTSRTYYTIPASPQKITAPRHGSPTPASSDSPLHNYRDGNMECNYLPPDWMDPNYVGENPEGTEPAKRQRTLATVRDISSNAAAHLTFYRTTHYFYGRQKSTFTLARCYDLKVSVIRSLLSALDVLNTSLRCTVVRIAWMPTLHVPHAWSQSTPPFPSTVSRQVMILYHRCYDILMGVHRNGPGHIFKKYR